MPRKKATLKDYSEMATGVRLSSHEKLCAERMKHIQESIKELSREVKSLRTEVSKGKGAVAVLVFIGTLVVSVIGFLNFK
ncbi:hypothetical protein OA508_00145 [Candidatus Pelagibacter sp.]|nr:hypothetical protein [Candidatus Pelagibacter sp.]